MSNSPVMSLIFLRKEIESYTLKKICRIVKGASHSQYDPGMPDAIQKAMLEIAFGEH